MDQVVQMRASQVPSGAGALWLSKHIDPCRRNSMSPCSVIVLASHLNQGCESGPLMEIIGIATVSSLCNPGPGGSVHNAQGVHVKLVRQTER